MQTLLVDDHASQGRMGRTRRHSKQAGVPTQKYQRNRRNAMALLSSVERFAVQQRGCRRVCFVILHHVLAATLSVLQRLYGQHKEMQRRRRSTRPFTCPQQRASRRGQ
jgi:hypothetical protein